MSFDVDSWNQASLPIRAGGIGIRKAVELAPSAFLASAVGCSDLIQLILPPHLQDVPYPARETALTLWQRGHDEPPPSGLASRCQKAWDAPRIQATYDTLLDVSPDPSA